MNNAGFDRFNGIKPVVSGVSTGYPYEPNFYYNYFFNGACYRFFGADSGTETKGEYKVDLDQKLIFLNPEHQYREIVLEYLSNGYEEHCGDFEIDIQAAAAMMSYLKWKDAGGQRKKYGRGEVESLKREFYNEKRLARMRLNPFKLNEMEAITHASQKLVPKS